MSASDPQIDLMALADFAQPRKLAFEIHRQLREQYGVVPHHVPLDGIARAVGIQEIAEHETKAFEGMLVVVGENGAIGLRKGMPRGRRNFTLGHELGHFLNPWHRRGASRFECNSAALTAKRAGASAFDARPALDRMEVEANEFSAALLVPAPEYRNVRAGLGREIDIAQISELARAFDVSKEFMARIFVDTASEKSCVVTSHAGHVSRIIPQRKFPYLGLRRGMPLPAGSHSASAVRSKDSGYCSALVEVSPALWLEAGRGVSAIYEQVQVQRDGWAMTLLVVDEEEEDDDADDRNWNRR